ncbi:M12 family metallo-peptidase [Epilithonimonas mollis]|uniref:Por secretion system C-terminal sorting domain-containing protein n=1 Tax=Epilithonimonas mollis TaxID=216903 RepID=A0A1M6NYV3_9FLAO|nr:M12 family metallo-peptidase [Epilithonimonas mollis]SHK00830.1 Por secretion system C-terminal sorting domain-containing protein [Epilithonimonas mollis]
MKTKLQLLFFGLLGLLGFAQSLKPVAKEVADLQMRKVNFEKITLFTKEESGQKMAKYQQAAADISVLKLNRSHLSKIVSQKPQALEMTYPFENGNLTVELVKVDIFSNDFNLYTDKGKVNDYTPGVYYRGIIKNDVHSLVAFSFFENDVVGIASVKDGGNIVLGKAIDSDDFVVYDDLKLRGKSSFVCGTDELMENQRNKISFDPVTSKAPQATTNCVRMYYEVANQPYKNNGSNVTTTTNWITAVHNNINTLYVNDGVKMSLKKIYIWTTSDPYNGDYNENLAEFSALRQTFDGDLAHLVNAPSTTSVAYLNSLCTTYKHAYSGIDQTFANVPTYSWTIGAMTHEMGHSLGSPHTHACAWNGNNTAIDGCGPQAGYDEGCSGPIPTKGTIMSYCHLNVGISFANGFGSQPAALIRSLIDSKACLGTDCITTCPITVSNVTFSNTTKTGFTALISDDTATSWKYRVVKMDGTIVKSGTVSSKQVTVTGLSPNTYYKLLVGTSCALENAFQTETMFLTDDDWCGKTITDSGGLTGNYSNSENFVRTFYPDNSGQKLKLTFTSLKLEDGYDFITIKNGPNATSPSFSGGANLTGTMNPGSFTSTHATGAITIVFTSDSYLTDSGWEAKFSCATLGLSEVDKDMIAISPNPVKDHFIISGIEKIVSVNVFDNSGKLIKAFDTSSVSKNHYDVSGLMKGNYIIIIQTENDKITKKLIK